MTAAPAPVYKPEFARDVAAGLTSRRKTLPACWLYDQLGSTLFEAITLLPEYGLTRADAALLERSAAEIVEAAGNPSLVVELGSGSGIKTRHLLNAASALRRITYCPIDISASALAGIAPVDGVSMQPIEGTYFDGLDRALSARRTGERALILFLGSTIGNFHPAERGDFLQHVRRAMDTGDSFLLGADLIKPPETLIRAYDDSLGVTAAFNLNLLVRINRELGGAFDIQRFAHEARYNERQSRIEMHLRSLTAQTVRIEAIDLSVAFDEGETIWTESCHKFGANQLRVMGQRAGWTRATQWTDDSWGFAETLFAR